MRKFSSFLENVKNFKTHDGKRTYKKVRDELYKLGYSVYTKILNTSKYTGIPQNRERTFIFCFIGEQKWKNYQLDEYDEFFEDEDANKDCPITYSFHQNFHSLKKKKQKSIKQYLDEHDSVPEKYYYTDNNNIAFD